VLSKRQTLSAECRSEDKKSHSPSSSTSSTQNYFVNFGHLFIDRIDRSGYHGFMKAVASKQPLRTVSATQAKTGFSAVLAKAGHEGQRIVIKKGSRPTAVLIGYEDFQRLVDLEDRFESALLTQSLKEDRFLSLDTVARRLRL
jgi:prevent-host-death family protein